jgi:hypothetical protein
MKELEENKTIILFVDNFYAKPSTWNYFETNIAKDIMLKDNYLIKRFSFLSTLSLSDIAKKLSEKIYQECQGYELILVTHGMGSVIIFRYLANLMRPDNSNSNILIQQIIFLAPIIPNAIKPIKEINYYQYLKYLFLTPFNPIQRLLLILKKRNLLSEINQLSKLNLNTTVTVPMGAICGVNDELVDLRAVPVFFGRRNFIRVDGNHLSIISPTKASEEKWEEFKKILIEPFGHRNTILIKSLGVNIVVKPGSKQMRLVSKERTKKNIMEDHIGVINYLIDISSRNICLNRFSITSFVQEDGYISEINKSYANFERAAAHNRGTFLRLHTTYRSEFDPDQARNPYQVSLELINGFNDAQFSDNHYHKSEDKDNNSFYLPIFLGMGDRYYKKVTINIDLSLFKHRLNPSTLSLHWIPEEMSYNLNYSQLINKISGNNTKVFYKKKEIEYGKWQFNLSDIRFGTFIFTWSLSDL